MNKLLKEYQLKKEKCIIYAKKLKSLYNKMDEFFNGTRKNLKEFSLIDTEISKLRRKFYCWNDYEKCQFLYLELKLIDEIRVCLNCGENVEELDSLHPAYECKTCRLFYTSDDKKQDEVLTSVTIRQSETPTIAVLSTDTNAGAWAGWQTAATEWIDDSGSNSSYTINFYGEQEGE